MSAKSFLDLLDPLQFVPEEPNDHENTTDYPVFAELTWGLAVQKFCNNMIDNTYHWERIAILLDNLHI